MDRVCPMLGLAGDRRSAVDGADRAHRCHAEDPPAPLDQGSQVQLCLTAGHTRCERYLAHIARTGTPIPGRSAMADGLVSTRLLLAPQPAWRGIAGRARGARAAPLIATGAGVLAVGIGAVAVAGNVLGTPPEETAARSSASAAAGETTRAETVSATPRPTATARPTPTPVPATPAPTNAPTAAPTPAPTAPPPPPAETYVVVEGDTLALIAQRFGTTTEALQAANDLDDPNTIVIGQVLTIP